MMRKPLKPCDTCGHAKMHHILSIISLPYGFGRSSIPVAPCQDCQCEQYKYKDEVPSLMIFPMEAHYSAGGRITLIIETDPSVSTGEN